MWIELFGTAMSAVIAVSLMQKNIRWLRIINAVGAVGFAVYGWLIGSWPAMLLNLFIFVVDIYYLVQLEKRDEHFDYQEVDGLKSTYIKKFIAFFLDDIHSFMPDFDPSDTEGLKGCMILRDIQPVALILYRDSAPGERKIVLDYAVPSYRDTRSIQYFFSYVLKNLDFKGIQFLTTMGSTKAHRAYLGRLGWQEESREGETAVYRMAL